MRSLNVYFGLGITWNSLWLAGHYKKYIMFIGEQELFCAN